MTIKLCMVKTKTNNFNLIFFLLKRDQINKYTIIVLAGFKTYSGTKLKFNPAETKLTPKHKTIRIKKL